MLAHAHLDGWDAPAGTFRRMPFAAWIADLLAWRAGAERMAAKAAATAARAELTASGCGMVAVHAGEDGVEEFPQDGGCHVLAWREVLDPFPPDSPALAAARWRATADPRAGLALHAPYTVDLGLAVEVFAAAAGPVSLHLGETAEERQFLARGEGALADLLHARRGRLPERRFASPVEWLAAAGGMRAGTLAVHGGDLRVEELRALAEAGVAIVFCPGTHQWFGRPVPNFERAGVLPAALGCDARSCNERLDPLREFRLACAQMPSRDAQGWWSVLTEGGARALGQPDFGRLAPGRLALPLRLADPRALSCLAGADTPQRAAAALCAWLAATPDPLRRVTTISHPAHA